MVSKGYRHTCTQLAVPIPTHYKVQYIMTPFATYEGFQLDFAYSEIELLFVCG